MRSSQLTSSFHKKLKKQYSSTARCCCCCQVRWCGLRWTKHIYVSSSSVSARSRERHAVLRNDVFNTWAGRKFCIIVHTPIEAPSAGTQHTTWSKEILGPSPRVWVVPRRLRPTKQLTAAISCNILPTQLQDRRCSRTHYWLQEMQETGWANADAAAASGWLSTFTNVWLAK